MVPRAYRYSVTASPKDVDEKEALRRKRTSPLPQVESKKPALRSTSPVPTKAAPPRTPTPPVAVPIPERSRTPEPKRVPAMQSRAKSGSSSSKESPHDPNALPPAVAALLAVTQIPRPKPGQFKRRPAASRRISIDELVNEWKSEESLKSNLSSSPALSMLLEDQDEEDDQSQPQQNTTEEDYLFARSTSVDSIPSLEDDELSLLSNGSLPTPESLRSRKSISNLRKEKVARSLPASVSCASDHPLVPPSPNEDSDPDDALLLTPKNKSQPPTKPKSSFKSNLTTSFQALKNAISTFSLSTASAQQQSQSSPSSPLSAEMLWSHPFLFPRFSPEIRPAIQGTPSQAQRRYLNPMPLTFEEQEAPYQLALHAPYLAEQILSEAEAQSAPTIQMQTYARGRRKAAASSKRSSLAGSSAGPDPNSEAGRALQSGVRQREPRENSDFLRVVVLEMNMRRGGKLEYGRAKIWLPPRQVSPPGKGRERGVPRRWVGVSAY